LIKYVLFYTFNRVGITAAFNLPDAPLSRWGSPFGELPKGVTPAVYCWWRPVVQS